MRLQNRKILCILNYILILSCYLYVQYYILILSCYYYSMHYNNYQIQYIDQNYILYCDQCIYLIFFPLQQTFLKNKINEFSKINIVQAKQQKIVHHQQIITFIQELYISHCYFYIIFKQFIIIIIIGNYQLTHPTQQIIMKEIKNNRYVKKYQSEATQIPLMDSFKNIEQEAQQQLIQISDQTIPEPPLSSIGFFQEPKQINNKLRTKNKKYYNSKTTFEEIQLYLKNDFSRNVEKKRTLNKYYLSEKHLAQANKRQIFRSNSKQIKKAIPQINMSDYIDFINIQKNETLQLRRLDSKQKNFRNLSERKLSLASSNQSRNHLQSPRKSVEQKKQKLPSKISLQNKKIQKIIKQQSLVNYSNEQQSKIDSYLNNCQKLNIINMQFTVFNRSKSKKIQPKNKNI